MNELQAHAEMMTKRYMNEPAYSWGGEIDAEPDWDKLHALIDQVTGGREDEILTKSSEDCVKGDEVEIIEYMVGLARKWSVVG